MKPAVLSDIHGNVRALRAVIRDLDHRDGDQVVNLADCLYGSVDPRPLVKSPSRELAPTCDT